MNNDVIKILEKIKNDIDYTDNGRVELYRNGKLILKAENESELDDLVNDKIENPNKNKKVIIVNYLLKKNTKNKNPFQLSVIFCKITPNLKVILEKDDKGKVITFSNEELIKYGFKKSYLKKIFDAIKNRKISLNPLSTESITTILELN